MQIGCHLPTQGPVATGEALLTLCRKAEEQQMASLWVSDHVVFPKVNTSSYPGGRFPHAPETSYADAVQGSRHTRHASLVAVLWV